MKRAFEKGREKNNINNTEHHNIKMCSKKNKKYKKQQQRRKIRKRIIRNTETNQTINVGSKIIVYSFLTFLRLNVFYMK